jgi:hypothetical protein
MDLEGYELVNRAIQLALDVRREVNFHPLISKYFRMLGADEMIPAEFRDSGLVEYLAPGVNWATVVKALREDEFALDVNRLTLVCGSAGFDGTQFKNLLAADFDIQMNKTSRNSVLLQTNINNTRSDIAQLIKVLVQISQGIEKEVVEGGKSAKSAFDARGKSLMTDVPDLPNFSRFFDRFRENPSSRTSGVCSLFLSPGWGFSPLTPWPDCCMSIQAMPLACSRNHQPIGTASEAIRARSGSAEQKDLRVAHPRLLVHRGFRPHFSDYMGNHHRFPDDPRRISAAKDS